MSIEPSAEDRAKACKLICVNCQYADAICDHRTCARSGATAQALAEARQGEYERGEQAGSDKRQPDVNQLHFQLTKAFRYMDHDRKCPAFKDAAEGYCKCGLRLAMVAILRAVEAEPPKGKGP